MTLVSDNIRYLRKLNGLTQEQFSRKINIKRSLLGAYEEGRANPNQQNIQAIAKAFNTTVELLTRQDLRKLRETPSLSIPLGQSAKPSEVHSTRTEGAGIRSDGQLDADENDPFQHPDFPDIFAQPTAPAKTPEPQPLSSVLNKYYRPPEEPRRTTERPAPIPPVITPPVRPVADRPNHDIPSYDRPVHERPQVDRLFSPEPEKRPASPVPSAPVRQPEPLSFNTSYEGPGRFGEPVAPKPATPNQTGGPAIPVVIQAEFREYGQRFQQAEYIHRLPAMQLPTLAEGYYRAFEAGTDFTFPGALLVGQFVRNWFDIADGKLYVLVINHQRTEGPGIFCRRVYNQVKIKGSLLLTADKADVPNREVTLKDVLEVWEIRAFVSQEMPPPVPNIDRLRQLADELRFEVGRL